MHEGRMVFAQLMDEVPRRPFRKCVRRYGGDHRVRAFSCWDQYLTMAFAQLTYRESLRDIEACLRAMTDRLYHMGIRGRVSRSTLADANERRDWRIYAALAQVLIDEARSLYASEPLAVDLQQTVYALDATIIDLCLTLFPWAHFRTTKAAVKLHTLLDLRGSIPAFIHITEGRVHDVNILDHLVPEPGSIYVLDRGYLDFARLRLLEEARAVFVVRSKRRVRTRRLYSHPVDRTTGLICDQTVRLASRHTSRLYPSKLRRVRYADSETGQQLTLLSNDFTIPPLTVAELYRCRWQVELFFKWIKQHLRIKHFYGTSDNAVKTQIWIAISVYVLVAIVAKRLQLDLDLYTILQILSVTLFEKTQLSSILASPDYTRLNDDHRNQLNLFDL
jgi:hypothetical protein